MGTCQSHIDLNRRPFKMWHRHFCIFVILASAVLVHADVENVVEEKDNQRSGKVLPIFQVVRFPNDVCTGASRNGTCFTAEECSAKGGTSDGSCASGFGVCCVITLSCGGSSSENNSYIVQGSTTSAPASPCTYSVCPCSTDICRIRYDFTTNVLATQSSISTSSTAGTGTYLTANYAAGACLTDQMSITSPGGIGSPIICGYNSGQHMVLDTSGAECQTVNFNIGSTTTTTRSWDISVTQYTCGQEDLGGPPGCLQYYTGTTGLVKNFGYPSANTASSTAATSTHLQNQNYQACVRRSSGMCYICWAAWHTSTIAAAMISSFGLSNPAADADNSATGTECVTDYVIIPNGQTSAIAAITTPAVGIDRFCGRQLSVITAMDDATTVCSRSYPFRLGVVTDNMEVCTGATAIICEANIAAASMAGGILGFALGFQQMSC